MTQINLPPHKCSLTLEHNRCKDFYQTVGQYLAEMEPLKQCPWDWKNEEQKARAISTNEIWILHWYPETPIGFNSVAAPTLEELLEFANAGEK